MVQHSILSMFKKSNDRVGNPVQDKIWLGEPDNGMQCRPGKQTETLSGSPTGNPTLIAEQEQNWLGEPDPEMNHGPGKPMDVLGLNVAQGQTLLSVLERVYL